MLGVRWNVSPDQIVVNLDEIVSTAQVLEPTKRNVVKIFAPVVIRFKIFLQELCEAKLEWDEPLPNNLLGKWHSLKSSLEEGQPISIPRCYFNGVSDDLVSCTLC